jgi:hypothetical protein
MLSGQERNTMSNQPPCGPFTDGYIMGQVDSPLVPEGLVKYRDEACLGERPRREEMREEIADYVLARLGAPVVRVELDSQQLSIAIDEAIKRYERGAPKSEYEWFYFNTVPNVTRYKMPCDIGFIRDVQFREAHNCFDGASAVEVMVDGTTIPFYGSAFSNFGLSVRASGYPNRVGPAHVDVGEWHLFQSYNKLFQRLSSREPSWEISGDHTITIFPIPKASRTVGVQYLQRKKDWGDTHHWIKNYALALAKDMLGRIRSKYDRYVSPSGGVTMDGPALIQEAREDMKELEENLMNLGNDHLLPIVG